MEKEDQAQRIARLEIFKMTRWHTLKVLHVSGRGKGRFRVVEGMPNLGKMLPEYPYAGTFNVVLDHPVLLQNSVMLDDRGDRVGVPAKINGLSCVAYRFKDAPLHVFELISHVKISDFIIDTAEDLELALPRNCLKKPSWLRTMVWRIYYNSDPKKYYDNKKYKRLWAKKSLHKLTTQRTFSIAG